MLNQEWLKALLDYDPESGDFVWKVSPSNNVKVGSKAGSRQVSGYHAISVMGTKYYSHRLAFMWMMGRWPEPLVDHINRIKEDNRWDNLRESNNSENMRNVGIRKSNTSGKHNVSYVKRTGKYEAYSTESGVKKHIGHFNTLEEAGHAAAFGR